MLHRIVSRSVVAFAAVGLLASCEDNTTGTPLTPPPPSTAVDVVEVAPETGYTVEQISITLPSGTDTTVFAVTPDPVFEITFPDGSAAVGQIINFNLNLPGFLAQSRDTVDAAGLVSPGRWVVANVCPNPLPTDPAVFCRPTQSVIAAPASGRAGTIAVNTQFPADVPAAIRASR